MFCENVGNLGSPGEARTTAVARVNQSLAARGKEGFELVATPVATIGKTGNGGGVSGEMLMCFKRLAAH